MEQRKRDAGKGGTKECENVVREFKAMAEEELWSGWKSGRVTGPKKQQRGLAEVKARNQERTVGSSSQRRHLGKMLL